MKPGNLLVFTDLDGTLLEHDGYSWDKARTALVCLHESGVPTIPVSSKTLAELEVLAELIGFNGPIVGENGCVIRFPDCEIDIAPPGYERICTFLEDCRIRDGYQFTGFADMSVEAVTESTGLSFEEAALAKQRLASEPLLWQDSAARLQAFKLQAEHAGLVTLHGGRFLHLLGNTNKGEALNSITEWYRGQGYAIKQTIALGDSDNDRLMLEAADVPIIIRKPDKSHITLEERTDALLSSKPGPAGWNEMILQQLDTIRS
ncbi:HAD-IIB family hydrolase [Solemya velum gill symbiont]|uniref:HAD-IIB family hydrolase n=1 Tax=Solemya velum gill symbiont TaxID=2340 RepID=UPI000995ED58|nr:HAD-IIB family hydrolase [Solemya velum gill symbiont]OOY50799.1 hypothetical protein BOV97_10160 [Solemya velum gill symbiont]OOY55025.1 hypothetical protein BOV99_08950 [Solemya velum gill symbiont]OOY55860.1 hypothetical protein BOW00_08955 [Solemya velum gill symbiont]OOY59412.1 hypothetical protein BOW02_09530 [Solemya velum gill symbiont]OOY61733.1 hypothetical protein BOW04_08700 [Solemya velum gill symbiont]